jgi:predicted RNase H-like nuclease (RuvC/YqgF family)
MFDFFGIKEMRKQISFLEKRIQVLKEEYSENDKSYLINEYGNTIFNLKKEIRILQKKQTESNKAYIIKLKKDIYKKDKSIWNLKDKIKNLEAKK